MPDTPDHQAELTRIISAVTDVPADTLTGSSRFRDLDSWSSLVALRLLTTVEAHFGVQLTLRQYFRTETVDELAAMITVGSTRPCA
ncbi:acyl carrier protein [Streptomyces sp. MST-110588]|uniref:acyl carrier protein n=1 Tax=Streptomyces sp. MST-110588 TaxID=2833628 RepID=UPI001F5E201C|nr:acyl carrier protein [Streptomyces sp. MST-110588]UNO40113.1 acyl carrier protein [Streptomyces sp. MST-110588]